MRKYTGIEIWRVVFACLIPLLHISFSGVEFTIIRQYLSRLGVPFFYIVAGMFLAKSLDDRGNVLALKQYGLKIGRMLFLWLAIYFPILLMRQEGTTLQEIVFKTPAYLWYLTGLLVASIPFCLFQNRKRLLYFSVLLYVLGTIFSESYKWLIGGFPTYETVFLTTRNGIFFALPLMCVGEQTWKRDKANIGLLTVFGVALIAEITLVGNYASTLDDRSMYFFLPLFMYEFVLLCRQWNPDVNSRWLGGISSSIYLMQFGIITVVMKLGEIIHAQSPLIQFITWVCVCVIPTVLYLALRKTIIVKILL